MADITVGSTWVRRSALVRRRVVDVGEAIALEVDQASLAGQHKVVYIAPERLLRLYWPADSVPKPKRRRPQRKPRHGALTEYTSHGCRCRKCRAAMASYQRGRRAARTGGPDA